MGRVMASISFNQLSKTLEPGLKALYDKEYQKHSGNINSYKSIWLPELHGYESYRENMDPTIGIDISTLVNLWVAKFGNAVVTPDDLSVHNMTAEKLASPDAFFYWAACRFDRLGILETDLARNGYRLKNGSY